MSKSVLKAVAIGTAAVAGAFLSSKIKIIAKDVGLDLVAKKESIDDIIGQSSTNLGESAKETLQCINSAESIDKGITQNI